MDVTLSEKIRILARRRNMTVAELAAKTGQSAQNLHNKLNRDNFTVKDLQVIATALNCDFETAFTMRDTGERI